MTTAIDHHDLVAAGVVARIQSSVTTLAEHLINTTEGNTVGGGTAIIGMVGVEMTKRMTIIEKRVSSKATMGLHKEMVESGNHIYQLSNHSSQK